jgi:hypothetical protein
MKAMNAPVTLDANDETNPDTGIFTVPRGQTASYSVDITGTITVTLQRRIGGTAWVAVEAGYTADTTKQIEAPGQYRLIASGVSGGSAETILALDR